jgi:hypothetical protein
VLRLFLLGVGDPACPAAISSAAFIAARLFAIGTRFPASKSFTVERLKTFEPGADKRAQAVALLTRATASVGPRFRELISEEAQRLTRIGNEFRVRHSEIDKEIVNNAAQFDYLFARMFGFIRYVLISTVRGG